MPRKLRGSAKADILRQVRESREQHFEENCDEKRAAYDKAIEEQNALQPGDPRWDEIKEKRDEAFLAWDTWFQDNYPGSIEERATERARHLRKSKKNIQNKMTVLDYDVLEETRDDQVLHVEWPDWMSPGNLVQTKEGDIAVIVACHDARPTCKTRNGAQNALRNGSVQLQVNGELVWRGKIAIRPLDD